MFVLGSYVRRVELSDRRPERHCRAQPSATQPATASETKDLVLGTVGSKADIYLEARDTAR